MFEGENADKLVERLRLCVIENAVVLMALQALGDSRLAGISYPLRWQLSMGSRRAFLSCM
jgi:hypothetical protein